MVFFVVPFNPIFVAIGQTATPPAQKANDEIWTYFATLATSAVGEVPVVSLRKFDDFDSVVFLPLDGLLLEILVKELVQKSNSPRTMLQSTVRLLYLHLRLLHQGLFLYGRPFLYL